MGNSQQSFSLDSLGERQMAKQKRSRQSWWPLYALALMMIGLLFLVHHLAPSLGWRTFLEVGVVVVGFGLMAWWLETHPKVLLELPSAEADSPAVESPQLELPAPLSSHVQVHFYVYSDPAIIYDMPEHPTNHRPLNGHHPAKIILALPEEEENF
jgi:hypothetical protein